MNTATQPKVSVVIPVYNGERMLSNAIRSVQAQTYQNWELTIGNNCSTDRTLAVAQEFAASDPRIKVYTYPKHVTVVDSHNTAFTLIADDAKYVKILGADDAFLPNCIEELVKVAEMHPSVGMVTSYFLVGRHVHGLPLPRFTQCMPGREFVRLRLLGMKGTGNPSVSLIRADIVRKTKPFYNPRNYAGDVEAYLDLLRDYDLGFSPHVLTLLRADDDSRTTAYLDRVDSYHAVNLHEVTKFGPEFLGPEEFEVRLKEVTQDYYRMLGHACIPPRKAEFWDYHLRYVKEMGHPLSYPRIGLHAVLRLLDMICNPKRTIESMLGKIWKKIQSAPAPSGSPLSTPVRASSTVSSTKE